MRHRFDLLLVWPCGLKALSHPHPRRVYNNSIAPPRRLPAMLFVSRMVVGAIIPEAFFRAVPVEERLAVVERSKAMRRR